ncbi:hypothetical protein Tco_0677688 [Tanacetum coccineum]|uniref:Uncharacterized protein n=1 Tax=Tanacetum coccineum TaxID=301880 RepID=A0ABQ4XCW6_9ASTR
MEISKADQIALDDALVAHANRLKISKCNLRLSSDVTSKDATLQVVYDVLKLTPFYKAFQVSADVPEIYMQEFWASAYIHNRSFFHLLLFMSDSYLQVLEETKVYWTMLEMAMFSVKSMSSQGYEATRSSPVPKKKGQEDWKRKAKAKEFETISEVWCDEDLGLSHRVSRCTLIYDSDDDISWKSSEDDQDEDKNEDDENVQDDDDDAKSGDDELKSQDDQDDDDEAQTESEDDDSDNEVEGVDVEGEKSDEDATYVEDQGNEADRDTNANLEGRDDVKADVVLPQVQATQEIEDTHVTLTPVNPDGQQQSSSVSSGFVSNMLNPNQDTGVDAIFGHNAEATSLVDILVTAIAEPSFFAPTNHPPTPTPLFTQLQQPPILTPATTQAPYFKSS